MLSRYSQAYRHHLLMSRGYAAWVGTTLLLACVISPAYAQQPCNWTTTQELQIPEDGVFNCTTVNIPANVTITFRRNQRNTPVTILASDNVTIAGTIILDGETATTLGRGAGGPGGFNGGAGGLRLDGFASGINGDGPGGGGGGRYLSGGSFGSGGGAGYAVAGSDGRRGTVQERGAGGPRYGTNTLLPLIGGSGGGGSATTPGSQYRGGSGGGGGGAILIASTGAITFNGGTILARGGIGYGNGDCLGGPFNGGGGGSGGAIRLVANTITGNSDLYVAGGSGAAACESAGGGSHGFVRFEAFDLRGFNPTVTPNTSAAISFALPRPAIPPNPPQLQIASIAGQPAPASPRGSLAGAPDIVIQTPQTEPVPVVIQGTNLPNGTPVQVTVTPENGPRTTVPTTLTGTTESTSATVNVTLPTSGLSVISATATIDLTMAKARPLFIEGERVDRIEVAATYGGKSEVTYITRSGRRIKKD